MSRNVCKYTISKFMLVLITSYGCVEGGDGIKNQEGRVVCGAEPNSSLFNSKK